MLLVKAPFSYAKLEKVAADEAAHRKAQFLIHKVLEEHCDPLPSGARRGLRGARHGVAVRLKRLRVAARGVGLCLCRGIRAHLGGLRRALRGRQQLPVLNGCVNSTPVKPPEK